MEQQRIRIGHDQFPPPGLTRVQPWPGGVRRGSSERPARVSHLRIGKPAASTNLTGVGTWTSWLRDHSGRQDASFLPDLDRAFVTPASIFGTPHEVVRHPLLTIDCKREILQRWAWDEYLLDLANAEGMTEGEPSRLDEVKAALRLVNEERSPDPAAPAAFIVPYHWDEIALAA